MTPTVRESQNIETFFKAIAYKIEGYPVKTFNYIATKYENGFFLLQGLVFLNTGMPQSLTHFESEHIRAGSYPLSELKLNASQLIERLASGSLSTPHGKIRFSPNEGSSFLATYAPIHQAGQSTQSRLDVLTILGGKAQPYIVQPMFDWELTRSMHEGKYISITLIELLTFWLQSAATGMGDRCRCGGFVEVGIG